MNTEKYKIVHLPKEEWKHAVIPMRYTTAEYYDVDVEKTETGYQVGFIKKPLDEPISHYPEEYDFPDKLYQDHWEKAYAWGIIEEKNGKKELMACIETCPEEWSNRLMVTELWVHESLRRQGVGHALMAVAKEQANLEHRRAIILETQSCNVAAISFYMKEGFELIGFDSCCYSNRDIERREVRLDMGFFPRKKKELREDIVIRQEKEDEYHKGEGGLSDFGVLCDDEPKSTFELIYDVVKQIPKGKVATYGQVAALAGSRRWSRVVGYALHANPDPEHIPCHRVVNRHGEVSKSFVFGGENQQIRLLESEGVKVDGNRIDLDKYRWNRVTIEMME